MAGGVPDRYGDILFWRVAHPTPQFRFLIHHQNVGAPPFAGFEGWEAGLSDATAFTRAPNRISGSLVERHRPGLCASIRPIATPGPQLRRRHQAATYRVLMHVIQLLHPLALAPHVEVI